MRRHLKSVAQQSITTTDTDVRTRVETIIADVRAGGDAAVRRYSEQFDSWSPPSFRLTSTEIDAAMARLPRQTIDDIVEVQRNVERFARLQLESIHDIEHEVAPGVILGHRNLPIASVGAYIPGGRYPCWRRPT